MAASCGEELRQQPARSALEEDSAEASVPPLAPVPRTLTAPVPRAVSFPEEQMIRSFLAGPDSAAYHAPWAVWLEGRVSEALLRRCLEPVLARHSALRTRYAVVGGGLEAFADPEEIHIAKICSRDANSALDSARAFIKPTFQPLERAPCRAALISIGEDSRKADVMEELFGPPRVDPVVPFTSTLVVFVAHHVAVDMCSQDILLREFCRKIHIECCPGIDGGDKACSTKSTASCTSDKTSGTCLHEDDVLLPLDRADFALWQRQAAACGLFRSAVERRVERFAGLCPAPLALPTDRPRPPRFTFRGSEAHCFVGADVLKGVEAVARRYQVTLFELMLALFVAVLCRRARQGKLVIGVPHHGREPETLGIVGCLMNILLACFSLPVQLSVSHLLQLVHAEMVDARRDMAAPIIEVLAGLRARDLVHTDASCCAAYQAVCNMRHDVEARLSCEASSILPQGVSLRLPERPLRSVGGQVDVQLELCTCRGPGAMSLTWGVCSDLFSDAQAQRWLADLVELMRHVTSAECCQLDLWQQGLESNGEEELHAGETAAASETREESVEGDVPRGKLRGETAAASETREDTVEGAMPRGQLRGDTAASEIREVVEGILPRGELLSNESQLVHAGLDSTSAAFLHTQLSTLLGRKLPLSLAFDNPTLNSLTEALLVDRARPVEPTKAKAKVRVRRAEEGDWKGLERLWRRHHHLLEMVPFTSELLLTGPPAWIVVLVLALAAGRRGEEPEGRGLEWLRTLLGYLLLVLVQHLLHICFARLSLAYELRFGELSPTIFAHKSRHKPTAAILLAEADEEVVGVVCVRLEGLCGSCRKRRKRRRTEPSAPVIASLWHAAVAPEWRNRDTAASLLSVAEDWARERGASSLEALCLNTAAKAACWNSNFILRNSWTGRLPLFPAIFRKDLGQFDM